jgi:glycosylphosphatidylinositol phospholipase D
LTTALSPLYRAVQGALRARAHGLAHGLAAAAVVTVSPAAFADAFPPVVDLAALDGTNGFVIIGRAHAYHFSQAVGAAGDVNGDGFDDLMIGDPQDYYSTELFGANSVVFGGPTLGSSGRFELDDLDGDNGFTVYGGRLPRVPAYETGIYYYLGFGVAGGDLNGDGFADVASITTHASILGEGIPGSGDTWVVFGGDSDFPTRISAPQELDGQNGFVDPFTPRLQEFTSISAAGDVDGDGYGDLIVGQPIEAENSWENSTGWTEILFGGPDIGSAPQDRRHALFRSVSPGDHIGTAVTGGGDINGDGFENGGDDHPRAESKDGVLNADGI